MASKILEIIVEPSKIFVEDKFKIKVKVQLTPSYNLITENNNILITENGEGIITEGDYYAEEGY